MRKEKIWVLMALLFSVSGYGQLVTFEDYPLPNQLYQRNVQTNMATIPVKGYISTTGYTQVRVQVTNEQGQQVTQRSQNISYAGGRANFQLSINIPAARNNHNVTFSGFKNGNWDILRSIDRVLAGDIFIINGQSNAQAAAAPHETDIDEYTRSWYFLHGWGTLNLSFPGLWGARLAKNISVSQNLPVAIFNQAVGAEPINTYLPTLTNSNYASLLKRFEDANMTTDARAALWFHGEANSWGTPTEEYMDDFRAIKEAWERDYGIDWTFVYQMRYESCTSERAEILEAHRRIGTEFSNTDALSTTNANHDNCHFYYENGYRELGDRMTELVKNRLYGGNNSLAYSHNITKVSIANNNDRKLILEFDQSSSLKTIGSFPYQDFRLEQSNASIIGGRVTQSSVELDLNQPIQFAEGLSYLGHKGAAPGWITNQADLGIFTFHNFPIANGPGGNATCVATYSTSNQQLRVENLIGQVVTLKVFKSDYSQVYACDSWSTPCGTNQNVNLSNGEYFIQIKTFSDNGVTPICDIFEEFTIGGTTPTYDCPTLNANIGDPCNDGNPNTTNDVVQNNCNCAGTVPPPTVDCPNLNANIGDPCNDGNPNTTNDVVQNNCNCAGTVPPPTVDCPNLNANIGDACNDSNPNTINDVVTNNCFCIGTVPPPTVDCPTLNANIGDSCNDGNSNTTNDTVQSDCTCAGTPVAPPPSGCNASYSISNNVVSFQNVNAPISFVKILKNDFSTEYECNSWSSTCQVNFTHTINQTGTYYVQIQTHQTWTSPADCNIFETINITALGGGGTNSGTCDNISNGGFITGNQEICPGETPTPFVNSTFPSGGSGTIEYRWLRQLGACPGASSEVIPGANQSSYTPEPITETTYFRRQSRRVGCTSWTAGESNCVVKFVPNDCITTPPPNNDPCGVSYSISGSQLTISGLDFPITSVKVQDARTYSDVFSCDDWSNQCSNQTSVTLPSGEFLLVIQTFEDWSTPVCNINEMISVNSNRQGFDSNNFTKEKSSANPESVNNLSFSVFPNPAIEVLNIGMENYLGKDIELRLMDQLGKIHATQSIIQNRDKVLTFPIDNIGNGMYLLVVKTKDEKPVIKKILIKKG